MLIQSVGAFYLRFLRESGLVRLVGAVALMRRIREILGVFELVAIEVELAETREVGIAAAARDPSGYPHLARLHDTFDAILRQPLPEPLSAWAERVIAASSEPGTIISRASASSASRRCASPVCAAPPPAPARLRARSWARSSPARLAQPSEAPSARRLGLGCTRSRRAGREDRRTRDHGVEASLRTLSTRPIAENPGRFAYPTDRTAAANRPNTAGLRDI